MALVRCHECFQFVSQAATTCPHCGVSYPASKAGSTLDALGKGCSKLGCILTLAVTVPILLIAFCAL